MTLGAKDLAFDVSLGLVARLVSLVVGVTNLAVIARILTPLEYAVLGALSSLAIVVPWCDIGLGAASQNAASRKLAKSLSITRLVLCTRQFVVWLGVPIAGLVLISIQFVLPLLIGNESIYGGVTSNPLMLPVAVFIFSAIGLTSIANRMLFALGLARVVYWLSICASVATLGAGIALREDPGFANSLTAFLVLHAPLALAGGVGWFSLIARTKGTTVGRKWIRVVEILIARGRQYWLILFAGALIYGTDFIILSQSASVDELASYAALQRLIGLAVVSYGVFLANLWPRLTLKFSTAQHGLEMRAAVDELLRTAWIASGCTLLTGVFLWPVFDDAFRIIFGNAIQMPSTGCLIAALIHCAVRVWTDTLATALFAISDFKWFLKWVPIQIAVTVGAGLLLAAPFGSTGVVLGMLVGSVATACWLLPLRLLKLANAPILQSKPGS